MDYETLFPGRFIKSVDLKGRDVTLTIAGVKAEEIDSKMKAVLSFEGTRKEMVMNRTNAEALKLCFGRETNDWLGKRVTFYPAQIKDPFGDGDVTAIRVRGSPDIAKALAAVVQRGRKTIRVSVEPTGQKGAPKASAKAPPAPAVAPAPKTTPPVRARVAIEDLSSAPVTTHGEPPDDVELPGGNGLAHDSDEGGLPA